MNNNKQNKFWKAPQADKNATGFQKTQYAGKQKYYTQNKHRDDDAKVVHSLTLENSANTKNVKEPVKKYIFTAKNEVPSTSMAGAN